MKLRYYGSLLSLADVDPYNSYGWMFHLRRGSLASFLVSLFGAPHLGARIRHRILTEIFRKKKLKGSVFDVGCGFGLESLYLSAKGYRVLGIDKSRAKIEVAKKLALEAGDKRVKFKVADIFSFPPLKKKFDAILLLEVLEHVRKPEAMLFKISQYLKKNGALIVSCPAGHWINARARNFLGHVVDGYTPLEIARFVEDKGLRVEKIYAFGKSLFAKGIIFIDLFLLRHLSLVSAAYFFLAYPIAVFDLENFKSKNPLGYIILLRKLE